MIPASEFIFSCVFPLGFLMWWLLREGRNQWKKCVRLPSLLHSQIVQMVHSPYNQICVFKNRYLSWNGILFSRRLHVTLVFCICCWSYLETNFDVLGDISISDNAQNHETMQGYFCKHCFVLPSWI